MKVSDIRPPEEAPGFLAAVARITGSYADAGRWLDRKKERGNFVCPHLFSLYGFWRSAGETKRYYRYRPESAHRKALAEKTAELENVLESITDGFYALNSNWEVTFINKAAELALSCTREEVTGKTYGTFSRAPVKTASIPNMSGP